MPHFRLQDPARCAGLVLLLTVAGCAGMNDPFEREGTWQPEGVNDANLASMVANPNHLVQGVNDPESPGALSVAAIRRLLTDKVKPLPTADISAVTSGAAPTGSGAETP